MASRGENEGFLALDEFVAVALPGRTTAQPAQHGRVVNEGMSAPDELVVDLTSPPTQATQLVQRLEAAVTRLPASTREPYLLQLAGLTRTEIAARLGLTEVAVGQLLDQARLSLVQHVREGA